MLSLSVLTGLSININLAPTIINKQDFIIDQSLTQKLSYLDQKENTAKLVSPKPPVIKPIVIEPQVVNETPTKQTPQNTQIPTPKTTTAPQIKSSNYTLTIPKIGLNNVVFVPATMYDMPNLDAQMRYSPVWESGLSVEPCSGSQNTYLIGHSEPAFGGAILPGDNIFANLNLLSAGDIISIQTPSQTCSYQVTGWDKVVTGADNSVTKEDFNRALYPASNGSGMLSIQTCQKGSATVRLILRASKV